jgi:hypothetical protein
MSDYERALFPIKEAAVTFDTPQGDVPTDYKLIVREDKNQILSCMTNEYKVVKNETILKYALPVIQKAGGRFKECMTFANGARTTMTWHFPKEKVKVSENDLLTPEIIIKNSYDGSVGVNIMAGAFRLVCSNGMIIGVISSDYKNKHSIYNPALDDIEGIIKETIESTKNIFTEEFPVLINNNIKENHIVDFLKMFPIQTNSIVTQRLIADRPKTFWDLFNVGTNVTSHHMNRDAESTHKLEDRLYKAVKSMALREDKAIA